jgi:hypothetical protein
MKLLLHVTSAQHTKLTIKCSAKSYALLLALNEVIITAIGSHRKTSDQKTSTHSFLQNKVNQMSFFFVTSHTALIAHYRELMVICNNGDEKQCGQLKTLNN